MSTYWFEIVFVFLWDHLLDLHQEFTSWSLQEPTSTEVEEFSPSTTKQKACFQFSYDIILLNIYTHNITQQFLGSVMKEKEHQSNDILPDAT